MFFGASGGSTYGYKAGIPAFSLGGSQRLVAWNTNELYANQYFLGNLGISVSSRNCRPSWAVTSSSSDYTRPGRPTNWLPGPKPPNLPIDGAAGIIMNTIFGPVELAGAIGDYGRGRFFFRIGRIF